MKWIKASERLPETLLDTSASFFCRTIKYRQKKVCYFGGRGGKSLLLSNPKDIEWLDETPDTTLSLIRPLAFADHSSVEYNMEEIRKILNNVK